MLKLLRFICLGSSSTSLCVLVVSDSILEFSAVCSSIICVSAVGSLITLTDGVILVVGERCGCGNCECGKCICKFTCWGRCIIKGCIPFSVEDIGELMLTAAAKYVLAATSTGGLFKV